MQAIDITYSNQRVLDFYKLYITQHGCAPMLHEASEVLKMSKAGIHNHLKALKKKGYIGFRLGHRNVYLTDKAI